MAAISQTVHFDPAGGPLSARLRCDFANAGSFGLLLLEHDRVTIVEEFRDDFSSPPQNTHQLPGAAADQDGRVLDFVATVGILDASGAFAVAMTIVQDGRELATAATDPKTSTSQTENCELAVALSATPALAMMSRSVERLLAARPTQKTKRVPGNAGAPRPRAGR